jgi:spore germination protein
VLPAVGVADAQRIAASAAGESTATAAGVTAWLPYWEMPAALSSTLAGAGSGVVGTASPYWFAISGQGTVHDESGAGDGSVVSELTTRGVQVVPMVTEDAGMAQFARILASRPGRAAMVHALVSIADHDGYDGLDLDFENLAYDKQHNGELADRVASLYPLLVGQACAALRKIKRTCEVTVFPRTTSAHVWRDNSAAWVYDYAALAHVADRVQVMAYDDHSPGGAAGPIAPLPWVRQVIAYARSQSAPSHYELGVPAYGYDWYGPRSATAVYASQATGWLRTITPSGSRTPSLTTSGPPSPGTPDSPGSRYGPQATSSRRYGRCSAASARTEPSLSVRAPPDGDRAGVVKTR